MIDNIYTNFGVVLTGCIFSQVIFQSNFLKILLLIVWSIVCLTTGVLFEEKYSIFTELSDLLNKQWHEKSKKRKKDLDNVNPSEEEVNNQEIDGQ